ncbi:MAG: DUF3098 domain-containing protein [Bacteroidota bacterium]
MVKMKIFNRKKYFLLTLVIILLALGYGLMAGPAKIPGEFNEAVFSYRRITLAPVIILGAYGLLVFTIFTKK